MDLPQTDQPSFDFSAPYLLEMSISGNQIDIFLETLGKVKHKSPLHYFDDHSITKAIDAMNAVLEESTSVETSLDSIDHQTLSNAALAIIQSLRQSVASDSPAQEKIRDLGDADTKSIIRMFQEYEPTAQQVGQGLVQTILEKSQRSNNISITWNDALDYISKRADIDEAYAQELQSAFEEGFTAYLQFELQGRQIPAFYMGLTTSQKVIVESAVNTLASEEEPLTLSNIIKKTISVTDRNRSVDESRVNPSQQLPIDEYKAQCQELSSAIEKAFNGATCFSAKGNVAVAEKGGATGERSV